MSNFRITEFVNRYRVSGQDYKLYKVIGEHHNGWRDFYTKGFIVKDLQDNSEHEFGSSEEAIDWIFENERIQKAVDLVTPKQIDYIRGMCEYLDCEDAIFEQLGVSDYSEITKEQAQIIIPKLQKQQEIKNELQCDLYNLIYGCND